MTAFSLSAFLRERFLRDHAHLITPWNFGLAATKACNESLLRRGWLRCERNLGNELIKAAEHFADRPDEFAALITRRPVDKPTA